jgi:hypothetical protein
VAEQLLDGADVVAVFQQVRCEGVPERVARGRLGDPSDADGVVNGALEDAFVEMVAATLTRLRFAIRAGSALRGSLPAWR